MNTKTTAEIHPAPKVAGSLSAKVIETAEQAFSEWLAK